MQIESILKISPVMPVLTIDSVEFAVPLAKALVRGGVRVLEVTLRTPDSLAAIRAIATEVRDAVVGAGTVLNEKDLLAAQDAGAMFAVSPGSTPELLAAARKTQIPLLPGVATASELMMALALDYRFFKFFPAENIGGIAALKSLSAPFAQAQFCPTGGISLELAKSYFALPCVRCVGGSWLAPAAALKNSDWVQIETLAAQAVATLGSLQRK
jgi:2-dehydro-3-deoxyphosphogluconate aldolase/(4S)-4-hydroxy-2-oxoglutarate aldolase